MHFAVLRRQPGKGARQPQRLFHQRRAHPVVAGGGRTAFVEDQIDHLEHRGQTFLALGDPRHLEGHARSGQRAFGAHAIEQRLIEQWARAVERGTREHCALGHELALCGRLIKGYGSTNERGKQNLLHIVEHLAFAERAPAERAEAVRQARQAALADETGSALDRTLLAQGAPARPLRVQTVRCFKRRPAA